tara:strand:- start:196 stop:804 length:609 start_codon:yes stop_codon:yes gene_type:complete
MINRLLDTSSSRTRFTIAILSGALLIAYISSCAEYRTEVNRTGLLSKLKDKQEGNRKPIDPDKIHPVFGVPGGQIRVEDDDGTVTLYAKSIKHLMNHIIHALEYEERDLFVEQILSEITVDEFEQRGLDPGVAFDELLVRKREVYRLFHFMPMGESTPGLYPTSVGTNIFRLQVSKVGRELLWSGMDVSFEHGNYKLRWFVQ